ncbi:DUF1460 domain-containing protein [Mycobacterium sp. NAZ190054]|uniref:DUF1460 domain-containing protein n=1 Tax=Mycobacterium sp. NAZ190054 TaxID=1747766 RepID=UPI0007960AA4|nr:DUF1460 domain-containing protein [Mycobacterium sp. NAZ190054]KWX67709.1 hypothetical protein ASJ79_20730 [Mycobacterium sp. NAZ190054]
MPRSADRTRRVARTTWVALLWSAFAALSPLAGAHGSPAVSISPGSERILESMLAADTVDPDPLSARFLGTPYGAGTLIGSATEPEQLVVDLERVDCFTYADYVEALKRAHDRDGFLTGLAEVRYKDGIVSFANRRHFFTDWAAAAPPVATDVTARLSGDAVRTTKNLNSKDSGGVYLPGLPVVPRTVTYIPSDRVTDDVVAGLRTGDYLGAYAGDGGLDVTHVGIFVDTPDGPIFRNASSVSTDDAVVDTPLSAYLRTVPGIVVLRPLL